MSYPIPMQVHVIWHPLSDALCRPLAERIYLTLNRDPYEPLVPGIGIPVFFRSTGAVPGDASALPRPIVVGDTKLDLRIALITAELILDPAWKTCLDDSAAAAERNPRTAVLLAFDLSPGTQPARLAVRLDPASPALAETVMRYVLLQCCRLLGGRAQGGPQDKLGAAPLKLFISHTKRDGDGLKIAQAVKSHLDTLPVERFFDEVSIQPGDELSAELEAQVKDSAVVCIRTDRYVSSPWCRKELALAKRHRRPMVVLDALSRREPRSSPLLAHLPSMRVSVDALEKERLESVVNFIGLEAVRFLYANEQLRMLQKADLVPYDAILLTRPPEARDLAAILAASGASRSASPMLLHPDPMMAAEESAELEGFGVAFITPTSVWQKRLDALPVTLSLSPGDKAEQEALGLALHIEDAMRVIARQLLAAGAVLYYGGTLERGSLTQALFDMIGAYNRDGLKLPPLVNHTPWPWYEKVDANWLVERMAMLEVKKCPPPEDLKHLSAGSDPDRLGRLGATAQGRYALWRSLSGMRRGLAEATRARIVLGGRPHAFMGALPGIVEEVLLGIRAGRAVFVLGGFGGAAHLVAAALDGRAPEQLTREYQEKRSPDYAQTLQYYEKERASHPELGLSPIDYAAVVQELNAYGVAGLAKKNGLSEDENCFLFATASVDAALYLIMKGLTQLTHTGS